ncbi:MAG: F0F1 ATP synthase subunit A [Planctomycetota bacterium]|nr:F0F1 ATP synthase subunit A [Planctomycetota bacterium]
MHENAMHMLTLAAADPIDHVTDKYLLKIGDTPILTMHMVTLIIATGIMLWAMWTAAKSIDTGPESDGNDRYITKGRFAQLIEAMVVYLRDEMLEPVLGKEHTRRYLPFLLSLFFFVLFNNLFGMIPVMDFLHLLGAHNTWIGGTATANIAITGALALVAFVLIEAHAFREQGVKGWLLHNFGGLVPGPILLFPIALIVFVVEIAGHFIKPTALAIRLFANMVAGHTLMAVLLSFGYAAVEAGMGTFGIGTITVVSGISAIVVTFLELFVSFLQAFIFMFLTAVFISLMSHDDEHEAGHEEDTVAHSEHQLATEMQEAVAH